MPRVKFIGYITVAIASALSAAFVYFVFILNIDVKSISSLELTDLSLIKSNVFYGITIPIALIVVMILSTGFWIGWTILTIKVVPPMPEIVEKKDYSKFKALILCLVTLALGGAFAYGLYIKSFWALAVPAATIVIVVLGAVFWVGVAIITTRSTLPEDKA